MNESQEASLTEQQRYWLKHVQACEASGKRITEYAAENGIGIEPVASSEWRIQLPNGVSVAFAGSVDARTLTTVLSTVAALG